MTAITPGNNGTLKSDSAEGQLLELAAFIRFAEQLATTNPTNRNAVTVAYNLQTFTANLTFTIPAIPGINANGQSIITASAYLINTNFNVGTAGTFKSTTPEAYLLELITYIQIKESDITKNTLNSNNVTANYDSDDNVFSGSATIPIIAALDEDGNTKIIADEYLKD